MGPNGYRSIYPGDLPLYIVFYPLFPWMTAAVNVVVGEPMISALIVATAARASRGVAVSARSAARSSSERRADRSRSSAAAPVAIRSAMRWNACAVSLPGSTAVIGRPSLSTRSNMRPVDMFELCGIATNSAPVSRSVFSSHAQRSSGRTLEASASASGERRTGPRIGRQTLIWTILAPFSFGYLNESLWVDPSGGRGVWFSDETHTALRAWLMTWSDVVSGLLLVILGWPKIQPIRTLRLWMA